MWLRNGRGYKKILESFNTKLINLKTKLNFNKLQKILFLKVDLLIYKFFFHFQITQLLKEKKPDF